MLNKVLQFVFAYFVIKAYQSAVRNSAERIEFCRNPMVEEAMALMTATTILLALNPQLRQQFEQQRDRLRNAYPQLDYVVFGVAASLLAAVFYGQSHGQHMQQVGTAFFDAHNSNKNLGGSNNPENSAPTSEK